MELDKSKGSSIVTLKTLLATWKRENIQSVNSDQVFFRLPSNCASVVDHSSSYVLAEASYTVITSLFRPDVRINTIRNYHLALSLISSDL